MSFRINTNVQAANAYRSLQATSASQSKALERLSSGLRINRAGDDASGLVLSENLRSLTSGIGVAVRNAQDGIGVVQTAEGALTEVHSILQRMRDLAVGAANGGAVDATSQAASQDEVVALRAELDRIANTTQFGNTKLLNGNYAVTPGTLSAVDADNSITVGAGDEIDVTVTGGSGSAVAVTLSAGSYTGTQWAAMVQGAVRGALAASSNAVEQAAADNFSVSAETVGSASVVTFSNAGGANVALADGNNTPLSGFDVTGVGTVAAATGSGGTFQVGAKNTTSDRITVSVDDLRITGGSEADITGLSAVDLTSTSGAQTAIATIDTAITKVSDVRGSLGAVQNRFEHTIANLRVTQENLMASESRIRDADMAEEMVRFTRSQILTQAGTAMLAQANQTPSAVLSLLQ
jgi:flagellin